MSRPYQNRVAPDGTLHAVAARGTLFGNRGGRIHDAEGQLGRTRWKSKQWISCVLDFKGRHRTVMGNSYTEMFFLDEVTALAAGHRPCFECRRADAVRFATLWGGGARARAGDMDRELHAERCGARDVLPATDLPNGSAFRHDDAIYMKRLNRMHRWSFDGYGDPQDLPARSVEVLTPPSIRIVLAAGYAPLWHPSAGA